MKIKIRRILFLGCFAILAISFVKRSIANTVNNDLDTDWKVDLVADAAKEKPTKGIIN